MRAVWKPLESRVSIKAWRFFSFYKFCWEYYKLKIVWSLIHFVIYGHSWCFSSSRIARAARAINILWTWKTSQPMYHAMDSRTIFYTTNEIVMITKKLISRYWSLFGVRNLTVTDAIPGTGNKMATLVASFTFCYIRSRRHEQDPGKEVELAVEFATPTTTATPTASLVKSSFYCIT